MMFLIKLYPFFETLKGTKLLDFYDFKKIANITPLLGENTKYYENSDILKEIIKIKKGMNRNR
jgi:hypothetical protein